MGKRISFIALGLIFSLSAFAQQPATTKSIEIPRNTPIRLDAITSAMGRCLQTEITSVYSQVFRNLDGLTVRGDSVAVDQSKLLINSTIWLPSGWGSNVAQTQDGHLKFGLNSFQVPPYWNPENINVDVKLVTAEAFPLLHSTQFSEDVDFFGRVFPKAAGLNIGVPESYDTSGSQMVLLNASTGKQTQLTINAKRYVDCMFYALQ